MTKRNITLTAQSRVMLSCVVATFASYSVSYAESSPLQRLCNDSEKIIIADVVNADTTGGQRQATLKIARVLKGDLKPGANIKVSYTPEDRASGAPVFAQERGVFFLGAEESGVTQTIAPPTGGLGWRAAYLPASQSRLPRNMSAQTDILTKVIGELAARIEEAPRDNYAIDRFRSVVSPSDSHLVQELSREWANSADPQLVSTGLGLLIAGGDSDALVRVLAELPTLAKVPSDGIVGPLGNFKGTDERSISALGQIATSSIAPLSWRKWATYSLYVTHQRTALAYLDKLLDDSDQFIASTAVAGFSAYVTGMRVSGAPASTGPTLSEVLSRRDVSSFPKNVDAETKRFIHFGRFRDEGDAATHVAYWHRWYAMWKETSGQ